MDTRPIARWTLGVIGLSVSALAVGFLGDPGTDESDEIGFWVGALALGLLNLAAAALGGRLRRILFTAAIMDAAAVVLVGWMFSQASIG